MITDKDFSILYSAARSYQIEDYDKFMSEWSTSSIFFSDPDSDESDWEYIEKTLKSIFEVAHMDVGEIMKRSGLRQIDIVNRYSIPVKTVSNWVAPNSSNEHRDCPQWVVLLLAELTGVFKRPY